ncbi:MAG: 16S rRNA (cytosine(967)-C(5))-methyltransferase, partial [uncultured Gemmatimonadetes bacterium]
GGTADGYPAGGAGSPGPRARGRAGRPRPRRGYRGAGPARPGVDAGAGVRHLSPAGSAGPHRRHLCARRGGQPGPHRARRAAPGCVPAAGDGERSRVRRRFRVRGAGEDGGSAARVGAGERHPAEPAAPPRDRLSAVRRGSRRVPQHL